MIRDLIHAIWFALIVITGSQILDISRLSAEDLVQIPLAHAKLGHYGVVSISLSPDGSKMATASKDKTACIWVSKTESYHNRSLLLDHWI